MRSKRKPKPEPKQKDTLLVTLSDMHSGSNYALFLDRFWEGKNGNNHAPTSRQKGLRKQFERYCKTVAEEREGRRLVVVHDGDAIEGSHHNNVDVCTRDMAEQAEIHLELIHEFKKAVGWRAGDLMYYVLGTDTHVLDTEHEIANEAGAQQLADGGYVANHLELTIHGRTVWYIHEGARAGKGPNEGNALRNWLKDVYFDALKAHEQPPDVVYSGHVHQPTYTAYIGNDRMDFRVLHGIILPSWQIKTRYAYRVAPVAKNMIGGVTQIITVGGDIRPPKFCVSEAESMTRAQ
jgi:hypothetical protein